MKTFNGFFAVVSMLLVADHLSCVALLMSGTISYTSHIAVTGMLLFYWLVLHAFIGAYYYAKAKRGRTEEQRTYPRHNYMLIIQRLSGFLALLLAVIHISGKDNTLSAYWYCCSPHMGGFLCMAGLLFLLCVHIAVSLPKGMLTLGLTRWNYSSIVWQVLSAVLALALFAFAAHGMLTCWKLGGVGI